MKVLRTFWVRASRTSGAEAFSQTRQVASGPPIPAKIRDPTGALKGAFGFPQKGPWAVEQAPKSRTPQSGHSVGFRVSGLWKSLGLGVGGSDRLRVLGYWFKVSLRCRVGGLWLGVYTIRFIGLGFGV